MKSEQQDSGHAQARSPTPQACDGRHRPSQAAVRYKMKSPVERSPGASDEFRTQCRKRAADVAHRRKRLSYLLLRRASGLAVFKSGRRWRARVHSLNAADYETSPRANSSVARHSNAAENGRQAALTFRHNPEIAPLPRCADSALWSASAISERALCTSHRDRANS
jgi:hypothetical protein